MKKQKNIIKMTNEITKFFRIDEKENAIDFLGKALVFLCEVEQNPFNWKWFTIALHNATYSFMLLALQNPDLSGIWKEPEVRDKEGRIDLFNDNKKLISFMEAFKRIQDPNRMGGYVGCKAFSAEPSHEKSMRKLNDHYRNQFVHYRPMSWSIEIKDFIKISLPVLEIIEFLVFESGRVRFFEDSQFKRTRTYLDAIKSILKNYGT